MPVKRRLWRRSAGGFPAPPTAAIALSVYRGRRRSDDTAASGVARPQLRAGLETTAFLARTCKFESKWGGRPPLLPSRLRIGSAGHHCYSMRDRHDPDQDRPRYRKECLSGSRCDDKGTVVIRKRLRRPDILRFFASLPPCLVGLRHVRHRITGPEN